MTENWKRIRAESEVTFARHYERCVDLIDAIRFNSENSQNIVAMCFYCSIVELCPSLLFLIRENQFIGIPHLVRSMYEADIDLINALNNEEYIQRLQISYLTKIRNIVQEAHNSKAPGFMAATGGIAAMRDFLKSKGKELESLKQTGYQCLKINERFKLAQRDEEYISSYAYLCGHAHNDIGFLESRHLEMNKNGETKLVIFKEIGARNEVHLIDLANTVLIGASGRVHKFFESGQFEVIKDMQQELNALRNCWPNEEDTGSA